MTSMIGLTPIHGSYCPDDCQFLLTPISPRFLSIEEKERRIQTGQAHYSEMIHREAAPSARYLSLFDALSDRYAQRLAQEVCSLAGRLLADIGHSQAPIGLVSLARAGTPVGALLRRALVGQGQQPCEHYSISIIRDRGIDTQALDYILDTVGLAPERLVFIDAWTAKGVITRELRASLARYNAERKAAGKSPVPVRLAVISDIGGTADYSATFDDYAIPSGVLNATVSGLVSRSVVNDQVPAGAFHGCVIHDDLAEHDRSHAFLDQVSTHFTGLDSSLSRATATATATAERARQRQSMLTMLDTLARDYQVSDINHIKPGIAEATRVMLRRVPALLLVRDKRHPDVEHLLLLAGEKAVAVVERPDMPFHACSIIKTLTAEARP
ncbi:cysteine protease StiP family protein [Halomonas sp.]|uniref:cysteine protease StiP family protein n=1 Tax=Halomonas sp. TaxID=1486246 RepID=UPI00257D061D|nr:cysteine protease StiP family protein [Halomonas sp.]MCJ8283957.1 cysteine protease StiP family protein [Halomonas sp.]